MEFRTRTRVADSMGDLMQHRSNDEVIVLARSMANLVPATAESTFAQLDCIDDDACVNVVAAHLPERNGPQVAQYLEAVRAVTRQG